jgi:hypothetical protein
MKYSEIRDELNTGDIVLFSGKGFISGLIKWFTRSPHSHVGMVIRSVEIDMILLWESTTLSKVKDILSHTSKQGVQLVLLSERVNTYKGKIGIRKLEGVDMTGKRIETLTDFRNEMKDCDYEQNKLELAKSAYDGPFGRNKENLSSVFCSELIAEMYERWELLPEAVASNEYTPADFGNEIELEQGSLSEIIEVGA